MADTAIVSTSISTESAGNRSLFDSIASLFESSKFSDFVINCDGKTWYAHKLVIAAQSEFFLKLCTGDFKEEKEGTVTLLEDDKVVVHEMLRFMYTADFQDEQTTEDPCFTPMLLSVQVHTIADKYNVPALANLATTKFAARATTARNTEDFAYAIEEIYATLSESKTALRKCVIDTTVQHARPLYTQDLGKFFRETANKTPEFASELAARLVTIKNPPPLSRFQIKVKFMSGRIVPVSVKSDHTMQEIKERICDLQGISPEHQVFVFEGKQVDDDETVAECMMEEGSVVNLILSLRGS